LLLKIKGDRRFSNRLEEEGREKVITEFLFAINHQRKFFLSYWS